MNQKQPATATVTSLEYLEAFTHNGMEFHQYRIKLSDGAEGTVNAKTAPPWYGEGTDVAYQVTNYNGHLSKIRISRPGYSPEKTAGPPPAPRPSGSSGPSASVLARWAIDAAIRYSKTADEGVAIPQIEARAINLLDLHEKLLKIVKP